MAAHEIRAPLTVIRGYLDLLGRPLPPEKHDAAVRGALAAMDRVEAALDDLLMTAREGVVAGERRESLSMRALAEEVARELADVSGRRIDVVGPGGSPQADPGMVLGDAGRLRQVITNLIGNAVLHAPHGDILVEVADAPDRSRVVVSVEDQGPGVAPADREIAFEPRERLGAGDRESAVPGMGLGLTISRAIAEAHGGTLTFADPTHGTGARVVLELPTAGEPKS